MSIGALSPSSMKSEANDTNVNRISIGYYIGRFLKTILPRTWFCWVSRGTIQLQSFLRPHKWSYWTRITPGIHLGAKPAIYLGAMPLKNRNHLIDIHKLGIKAVLAVNKSYEFQNQLFAEPVKGEDWNNSGIVFKRISSPDLEPIKVSKLAMAVNYVYQQVNEGKSTYIHCTGGRGRSASVAICSLVAVQKITLEDSIRRVQQLRPQVMLSQLQINSLREWYSEYTSSSKTT